MAILFCALLPNNRKKMHYWNVTRFRLPFTDKAQLITTLIWSNGRIIVTKKLEIPGKKSAATHYNRQKFKG